VVEEEEYFPRKIVEMFLVCRTSVFPTFARNADYGTKYSLVVHVMEVCISVEILLFCFSIALMNIQLQP
jgi:hypothetical protein